ncbi:MAG: M20/M25/M40 family metallo-hydrolase [Gluconacetobacter liquefaciens]
MTENVSQEVWQKALAALDPDRSVTFLQKLVRCKSYSATDGERALVHLLADDISGLGLETSLIPVPGGRVNAVGRLSGAGGGCSLLFNGHVDTNPVTEGWTVDPWSGLVDDTFIYGIGVSNMKAGDAAYFCAVETLMAAGIRLNGDVLLSYVVGELQGGVGTKALVDHGVRADYFINSEPTDLEILTLHAAAFVFEIRVQGDTRHLSKREEGVDALSIAAAIIPDLNDMTFSGQRSERHGSVNRVHVGTMKAGLGSTFQDWRPAQVADVAELRGSGRYAVGQNEEGARQDMERLLDVHRKRHPKARITLHIQGSDGHPVMPPFAESETVPVVEAVARAYTYVRGGVPGNGQTHPARFYGTDAGHLQYHGGMQGVVCGPGGRFNTMPDERVELRDYIDMIRIYMIAIMQVCGVASSEKDAGPE